MKVKIFERSGEPSRLEREINDFLATLGPGAVLNTQTAIAAVRNENEQIETALLPKPDSLALYPARGDLGPASHPIGPFGLEDRRLSRSGPPQAYGRLWIARTQQASPLGARNTLY